MKDWASLVRGMTFKQANAFFSKNISSMSQADAVVVNEMVKSILHDEEQRAANVLGPISLMQMNIPQSLHGVKRGDLPARFLEDYYERLVGWLDGFKYQSNPPYPNVLLNDKFYEKVMVLMANGLWSRGFRPFFVKGSDILELNEEYPSLKNKMKSCHALFISHAGYQSSNKFKNQDYVDFVESIISRRLDDCKPTIIGDKDLPSCLRSKNDVLAEVKEGAFLIKCGGYGE